MPKVEATLLSPLVGGGEAAALIVAGHDEMMSRTPTSPTAKADDTRRDRREGTVINQAADGKSDGPLGVDASGGGMLPNEEALVVLEEAVDDGTVVNTTGTLIFTELEAYDLPETESRGGLLGYDRQDLYLSMSLQTANGREQESTTSVEEGTDGTVTWGGITIPIKYCNADDTVAAEVWNENPGSDVIIGKATVTKRHVRALVLLQGQCARIRVPLSRQRAGERVETRGFFVARVRLIRDADVPRSIAAAAGPTKLLGGKRRHNNSRKGRHTDNETIAPREAAPGFLVISGLTAYDLPPTEGLKFGGSQDPYVKITLGPTAVQRSESVGREGHVCDWTSQTLHWRVDPSNKDDNVWGQGLTVEVWNDNRPHTDALIGRGFVRPETLRQLQQRPDEGGMSCRVKLSRQGKGRKATVGMVVNFEADDPAKADAPKEEHSEENKALRQPRPKHVKTVVMKDLKAKDLGDILSFGFGALDNVELYLVARAGTMERTTPGAAVAGGKTAWGDSCLELPLAEKVSDLPSLLRLELWTLNPIQDDQVGYVEADLAHLALLSHGHSDGTDDDNDTAASVFQTTLELPLCQNDTMGETYKDVRPGVLSCTVELQRKTQDYERCKGAPAGSLKRQSGCTAPPGDGMITLPIIGATEGPGVVKVTVLEITLHEEAEAPEVRLTLLPGRRFATTTPLLEFGGDVSYCDGSDTYVTGVCNQHLEIPWYNVDIDAVGAAVTLQADVFVAGVLAGQRVLGQGRVDISEAVRSRKQTEMSVDITCSERGGSPFKVGNVSISVRFVDAWDSLLHSHPSNSKESAAPPSSVACLHQPGILRVFIVDARELSGLKPQQDPYVVVERMAADPAIACQAKPFSSAVATISEGRNARWLESCDLRVGEAEADFLREQPGGGSISFRVALTDRDVRGGDESISSLEVVVTPDSLAERKSSVLWHRLFSQGRDRGFVRLGCCWIPADLEPVNVCGLRPEERVEAGTLYLWLKEGRNLANPSPTAQRVRGLPPLCEIELRPYAKAGRKKARGVLGCARVPEPDNPDLDSGVFHKFIKMDFAEVAPCEDRDLAETSPSFLVSVYTKLGEKKIVSGRAEILLASLCGYKTLNGEAVLRLPPRHRDKAADPTNVAGRNTGDVVRRGSGKERKMGFHEADAFSCPVASVDKTVPLVEDEDSSYDRSIGGGRGLGSGRGGELRLRALFVPDRLADALGVRSAIKVRGCSENSKPQDNMIDSTASGGSSSRGDFQARLDLCRVGAVEVPKLARNMFRLGGTGQRVVAQALSRAAEASMRFFTEHPRLALPRASEDGVEEAAIIQDSESQVLDVDATALPGALEVYLIRATDIPQIEEEAVDPVVQLKLLCSAGGEVRVSELGRCSGTGVEWNHQFSLLVDDANVEMLEILILDGCSPQQPQKPMARCKIPLMRYAQSYHAMQTLNIGQVTPERFKLTDHRGRGCRGNVTLSLNFLPEVVGQAHILREAFAPTTNLLSLLMGTGRHHLTTRDAAAKAKHTISILVVCMDGGDVSREDRVRVRVSLAGDSDDWKESERFGGATNSSAVSSVGVVDEEAAVCRWDRPQAGGEEISPAAAPGELLTLSWEPLVALSAWHRGRASVLKFEISRGPGRPAEWTGFVPTAGLVHSPRSVFERAIPLTGRVGSEPPTSARTAASAGSRSRDDRPRVSLEVAMAFQPAFSSGPILDAAGNGRAQPVPTATPRTVAFSAIAPSPFHPDMRRIPPEAGELVVHCLRARNLRLPRNVELSPKLVLTAVPDGEEVETSTPNSGPGGRHPVWGQTRTLSIADAVTARVVVRVRNTSQLAGDNVVGEVELSMAGIVAAEHGVAAAVTPRTPCPEVESSLGGSSGSTSFSGQKHKGAIRNTITCRSECRSITNGELSNMALPAHSGGERTVAAKPDKTKPCGVEAWFPLFAPGRHGGGREREQVGEVRLACRFLSTDFMLQRELTAGADEGDNGPIGDNALRYKLERRPGRLFVTIRCCRALPKAMIGERAPVVEARLRHGGWNSSTKRQVGLNPTFNESMVVEVMWTPQDLKSPELVLEVKDKALGGGLLATMRIAIAPFILHPSMPAEIWCPLLRSGDTNAGAYCGLVYVPSPGGRQPNVPISRPAISSVEDVADPELAAISRQPWCGMIHVHVLSARGLPACSKDPQVGVRLRVGDGPLPPFQRTGAVRGGGGEPQFNATFLLGLRQDALGLEDQSRRVLPGRTPVLEVEVRGSRGRGNVMGGVEIPVFPLWFQGHMTRVWYPMRSSDGESEARRVFLGLQFIAEGGTAGSSGLAAGFTQKAGGTGRRRYLFLEVRQGRDLRLARGFSGHPTVHLEMLGSGSRGKTTAAKDGITDPKWPDGAGCLALPYPTRRNEAGGSGGPNEVLRITVLTQREDDGHGHVDGLGDRVVGHCDWPLPAQDLEAGRPVSSWHALWEGGTPAGAVYLRCRVGYEGEALDHPSPHDLQNDASEENSAMSPLALGSYHVEFLKVRGFERTLHRMGFASDSPLGASSQQVNGLPQWNGAAYLIEARGSGGEGSSGAASAPVGSGQAVAVGARGRGASWPLCAHLSLAGERDEFNGAVKTLKALSYVPLEKLGPIVAVPGSELLEWFPMVDAKDGGVSARSEAGEADAGQVLLSIRYAPLAVGVLDVAIREVQLAGNKMPAGNLKALTRILPAQTGGAIGHKVRSTPERRGVPLNPQGGQSSPSNAPWGTVYLWEDTCPHRLRFNNAFNKQPATLHVSVVRTDRMLGFASVGVEAIVHDVMTAMSREITEGSRTPRESAHDLGPVGIREGDFSDPVQAWYTLKTSLLPAGAETRSPATNESEPPSSPLAGSIEVGRVRVEVKFAPHPNVLVKNWQEGAAVMRASGVAAMKAIFYRLNRSGSLVVDTEDLRRALVDAVEAFLAQRAANADTQAENRAHHAGEFVLLMSQGIKSNLCPGRNKAVSESAADSILTMMDRDRMAEVSFTEYCTFLSQAAAWQAEAAVGDLVSELAEDNDDENSDDDSDDDPLTRSIISSDGDGNRNPPLDGQDGNNSNNVNVGHVGRLAGRDKGTVPPLSHPPQHQSRPKSVVHDNNTPRSNRRLEDGGEATPGKGKPSAPREPSRGQASTRDLTAEPPKDVTSSKTCLVQDKLSKTRDAYVGTGKLAMRQAAENEGNVTAGKQPRLPVDVPSWMVGDVLDWLSQDMQLPKHEHKFREASVDGLVLCNLTDALLEEDLGVSEPLHRLKILRHVQELCKTQPPHRPHPREENMRATPMSQPHARQVSIKPRSNTVVAVAEAGSPDGRHVKTGGTSVHDSLTRKPKPPMPPVPLVTEEAFSRRTSRALQSGTDLGAIGNGEDDELPTEGFTTDEVRNADTMNNVRGELPSDDRLGHTNLEALSPSKKGRRHLPGNATTTEVREVVQAAMWEAAALLEEQAPTGSGAHEQVNSMDDFPPAWWGSSDGGTSERFNDGDAQQVSVHHRNGGSTSENGGQTEARLLFDKFRSDHLNLGADKSPRHTGSALKKLTRHRLELGIRVLLQIDMRWEQWQLFLDSIASLRTQGYLSLDEFAKAFAFQSFCRESTTPRSLPHSEDQPETTPRVAELSPGSLAETTTGWGVPATADMAELQGFVMDIAGALRTCRSTLGGVISEFDPRDAGEVSVSEFMSLVKALTGRRRYSTTARAWVGGFDRKQAYRLLRCVDKDGDRRVALRDLVVFIFVTWTAELSRLARDEGQDQHVQNVQDVRQRRRQLQKDLRRHFPAKFRRALNLDEIEQQATVPHGPFSALLSRLRLDAPSPPSPPSQPTFASPLRGHRETTSRRGSSRGGASVDAERSSRSDSSSSLVVDEAQGRRQRHSGRNRRALSIPTPTRRPNQQVKPANNPGERGRLRLTTPGGTKQLGRRSSSSFEERVLSVPPRVDLSSVTLTASQNRELLAQGTFRASNPGLPLTYNRTFQTSASSSSGRERLKSNLLAVCADISRAK